MARNVITLGEVASHTNMIELRCGRCDRHGRLSIARLLTKHDLAASMRDIMQAQIGDCPRRDDVQIQNRCDPFCPDLSRLFGKLKTD